MKTLKNKDFFPDASFPFMIVKNSVKDYPVHTHEFFEFFYVVTGKCLHILDGKEEAVSAGDIVLMEPGRAHGLKKAETEQFEIYNCIFLPEFIENRNALLKDVRGFMEFMYLEPFKKGFNRVHLTGPVNLKTLILLDELQEEFERKPRGYAATIKIMLSDLLVTLVRFDEKNREAAPGKSDGLNKQASAILKSIEYIDSHFKEDISLDDISLNKTGITKEYFCSVFKKVTGKTFTEYVNNLRLENAAKLLTGTGRPVTDIAYESGFNDLSYFNRAFKGYKKTTPKKFQGKCGGKMIKYETVHGGI